jgi:hypothetical protein
LGEQGKLPHGEGSDPGCGWQGDFAWRAEEDHSGSGRIARRGTSGSRTLPEVVGEQAGRHVGVTEERWDGPDGTPSFREGFRGPALDGVLGSAERRRPGGGRTGMSIPRLISRRLQEMLQVVSAALTISAEIPRPRAPFTGSTTPQQG